MTQELKYQIIDKIREMISAPSCCQELKTKADEYLVAVGTTREDKKFRELVDEIKADILPVDAMDILLIVRLGILFYQDVHNSKVLHLCNLSNCQIRKSLLHQDLAKVEVQANLPVHQSV